MEYIEKARSRRRARGASRDRPTGNDGSEVTTLQTDEAAGIGYLRPNGSYETPIGDGALTKNIYRPFCSPGPISSHSFSARGANAGGY